MKIIKTLILCISALLVITGCLSKDNATVTINLKQKTRALSEGAPSSISFFKIYVSAPDIEDIVKEADASQESITLSIKPGNDRKITLAAFDSSRFGSYAGSTTESLSAGESKEVTILMKETIRSLGDAIPGKDGSSLVSAYSLEDSIVMVLDYGGDYPGFFEVSEVSNDDEVVAFSEKYPEAIIPDPDSQSQAAVFQNRLFFAAGEYGSNMELWVYDGTAAPRQVADLNNDIGKSSDPGGLTVFNNSLYFFATGDMGSLCLWRLRDASGQPEIVASFESNTYLGGNFQIAATSTYLCFNLEEIEIGSFFYSFSENDGITKHSTSDVTNITLFKNSIYFSTGNNLYYFDGTREPQEIITDYSVFEDPGFYYPELLTVAGDKLYFTVNQNSGSNLFSFDGNSPAVYGTNLKRVPGFDENSFYEQYGSYQNPVASDDFLFLYAFEGEEAIYSVNTGSDDVLKIKTNQGDLTNFFYESIGNALFFTETVNMEVYLEFFLFYYNNTMPVSETNPKPIALPGSSSPETGDTIIKLGNRLIFNANHDSYGSEPYIYEHYE